MQLQYNITPSVRAILKRWDWLGFDSETECAGAILTHEDWAAAWDLKDAHLDDLTAVAQWREAVLLNNRVNAFGNSVLMANFWGGANL
jgi:hypothetical protein